MRQLHHPKILKLFGCLVVRMLPSAVGAVKHSAVCFHVSQLTFSFALFWLLMSKHPKHSHTGELSDWWGGELSLEVDQLTENRTDPAFFFSLPCLNYVIQRGKKWFMARICRQLLLRSLIISIATGWKIIALLLHLATVRKSCKPNVAVLRARSHGKADRAPM